MLNRGGCEGVLHAAQALVAPLWSGGHLAIQPPAGSILLRHVQSDSAFAALAACHLLVAVDLTMEPPQLVEDVLCEWVTTLPSPCLFRVVSSSCSSPPYPQPGRG